MELGKQQDTVKAHVEQQTQHARIMEHAQQEIATQQHNNGVTKMELGKQQDIVTVHAEITLVILNAYQDNVTPKQKNGVMKMEH